LPIASGMTRVQEKQDTKAKRNLLIEENYLLFTSVQDWLKKELLRPSNKFSPWVYFVLWLMLAVIFVLSTKNFSFEYSDVLAYAAMFFAIPVTYLIYAKVEKGFFDFVNSLRLMIAVLKLIFLCTSTSILVLPIYLIVESIDILENVIICLVINISIIIFMGLLATILSWINNTSPLEELGRSKDFLGL